jgi:glucosamine--fructose-6-phosphate aminotransferase (isomerizing)
MSLMAEIREQPGVIERALETGSGPLRKAAAFMQDAAFVVIAARGTSDNAARYARYVWETRNRVPVMLAAPSVYSLYASPPRLHGGLVVGLSQSGQSPDIVGVLEEGRRQGCPTVAITNSPGSPLADAADVVIDIGAGAETAVAATKSYTAQLLAIARISIEAAPDRSGENALNELPAILRRIFADEAAIEAAAHSYREMERCVVLGRGYHYASAYEWSLKLKELAYVAAEPYSPADFRHGPIAMIASGYPALAIAQSGRTFDDMLDLLRRLAGAHGARLLVISDRPEALELAADPVRLPTGLPEWIGPLAAILPAQLFTYHLTRARGHDPDNPRGLEKVTLTT